MARSSSRPSTSKRRGLAAALTARYTRAARAGWAACGRSASTAITPQHSFGASSRAWAISSSSSAREMSTSSPPDGRVKVLDLVHRQRVDAAGEVLPAVVGHDEHDVALIQLARDAHGDARDGTARDAREEALFVQQPARPRDRVAVGYEALAVQQGEIDDRGDEAVVQRAQPLDGLALHRLGRNDLDRVAEGLLQAPAGAHQRPPRAQPGHERGHLVELF